MREQGGAQVLQKAKLRTDALAKGVVEVNPLLVTFVVKHSIIKLPWVATGPKFISCHRRWWAT